MFFVEYAIILPNKFMDNRWQRDKILQLRL